MYFSKLSILGFKSFLNETEIPLEAGLTGIVGPNGCGKSNVVEALRWVMGESNARKMRGGEMDDVIFMGTHSRAARQLAEVTLTIVNDKGQLPHPWQDLSEIAVKRSISRGAGSHYRINGKEVRSKDVQYLFMERATGASSAGMVAQGRISNIISAKPSERRLILEEAAGVRALSARRHESELKLDMTAKSLEEVDKILINLETNRHKLLKDAKQAEQCRQLNQEIDQAEGKIVKLKMILLEQQYQNYQRQLQQLTNQITELSSNQTNSTNQLATTTSTHLNVKSQMDESQRLLADLQKTLTESIAELRRVKDEILLLTQRREETISDLERAKNRINDEIEQEKTLLINHDNLEKKLPFEETKLLELRQKEQQLLAQLKTEETNLETYRQKFMTEQSDFSKITTEIEFLENAIAMGNETEQQHNLTLKLLNEQLTSLKNNTNVTTALTNYEQQLNILNKKKSDLIKQLETVRANERKAQSEWDAAKEKKQQELHQLELQQNQSLSEMTALEKLLGQEQTPLFNHLTAKTGFEKALAIAFQEEAESDLTNDKPYHWQDFGGTDYGEGNFTTSVPLETLGLKVTAPKQLKRNLSLTYWADNFNEAKKYQQLLKPGEKIVSQDGGLIRFDGFTIDPNLTGTADNSASRKLAAKNRLSHLAKTLPLEQEKFLTAKNNLQQWQEQAQQKLNQLTQQTQALQQALQELEKEISQQQNQIQTNQKIQLQNLTETEKIQTKQKLLQEEITKLKTTATEQQKLIAEKKQLTTALTKTLNQQQQQLKQLEQNLEIARDNHVASQLLTQQQENHFKQLNEDLKNLKKSAAENFERKSDRNKQLEILQQRLTTTEQKLQELTTLPAGLSEKITFQEKTCNNQKQQQDQLYEDLLKLEQAMRSAEKQVRQGQEQITKLQQEQVKTDTLLEVTRQKIDELLQNSDGKDLPNQATINAEFPEINNELILQLESDIKIKINKREKFGPVNYLAAEELSKTEKEIDKLQLEKSDLDAAIGKLRTAIIKLNSEAREKIQQAFINVNANFQRLFQILFNGGEASLYFDDNADPLTAGLEFTVRPPGKKSGALSLLSGGEQTLTALALIFAVMDMNPPPIAVLDEVDAPLDDANIHRFTQLLRQRKTDHPATRYLVITHHRLTMARMDRLFGVTMAEKGLSTLVGVNLETASEFANKKVA